MLHQKEMWVLAGEIELPCKYYLYAPTKYNTKRLTIRGLFCSGGFTFFWGGGVLLEFYSFFLWPCPTFFSLFLEGVKPYL